MAQGPGRYDDLCTYVRERAQAEAAIVIVLGGRHGAGFSVQVEGPRAEEVAARLPGILESMAAAMRAENAARVN